MSDPMSIAVLLLNGGIASTAITPLEVFNSTGQLWNVLSDEERAPPFTVTTATIDGQAVRTDRRLTLSPETSFGGLGKPDLVFVPAGGLELDAMFEHGYDIDEVVERNAAVIDWLKKVWCCPRLVGYSMERWLQHTGAWLNFIGSDFRKSTGKNNFWLPTLATSFVVAVPMPLQTSRYILLRNTAGGKWLKKPLAPY